MASYSLEDKARARSLYIEAGLTFEQVAGETGISVSHLKGWAKEGDWSKQKQDFERDFLDLHAKMQRLKLQLVNNALDTNDPQKIYALGNLMRATARPASAGKQSSEDRAAQFLEWMSGLISYIEARDQEALRALEPHIRGFADTMKQQGATM